MSSLSFLVLSQSVCLKFCDDNASGVEHGFGSRETCYIFTLVTTDSSSVKEMEDSSGWSLLQENLKCLDYIFKQLVGSLCRI